MRKNLFFILAALCITSSAYAQLVFEQKIIDNDIDLAVGVSISDLNGDNRMDIIGLSHGGHLNWYENNGQNNFTTHVTDFPFSGAEEECIYACDMDNDGDIDIVGAERDEDKVVWLENDGLGSFERHVIDATLDAPWSVYATDMDNDGDVDVLCAANFSAEIVWFENNGSQSFAKQPVVQNFDYATTVFALDMDGDNDVDILGGAAFGPIGQTGIFWWENIDNNFSVWHPIALDIDAESVYAFDADNDTDMDILGSSASQDHIFLWKNDGNQNYTQQTIAGNYDGAESVFTIDLDGDNDQDILAVGYWQENLDYWENDGNGNFTIRNIGVNYEGGAEVHAADIDGDGDIDLATANSLKDDISIWINQSNPVSAGNLNSETKISVYPNPSSETIAIKTENDLVKTIKITNQAGKLVFSTKTSDNSLDLSMLPSGIYFLTVKTMETSYTQRIIKQ